MIDMMGKRCGNCYEGHYQECSVQDDWDGMVTCPNCQYQVRHYPELDAASKTAYARAMSKWNFGPIPDNINRVIGYHFYYGINFVKRNWRNQWEAEVSLGHGEGIASMGGNFPWIAAPDKPAVDTCPDPV